MSRRAVARLTPSAAHRMVRSADIYHLALAAVALGLRPEPPPAGEQLSFEDVRPADTEDH